MKPNKEQIIRALENYLEVKIGGVTESKDTYWITIGEVLAFIKELIDENDELCDTIACLEIDLNNARANTVREFAKMLKKHFRHDPAFLGVEQRLIMGVVDQIANEVLEEV